MKMIVRQVSKNGYMMEIIPAVTAVKRQSNWLIWLKKIIWRRGNE